MSRAQMRGVRFGVDVGEVRVGVAVCDPDGLIATPLTTLRRDRRAEGDDIPSDLAELSRLIASYGTVEVVVGLPITLAGAEGHAARHVRAYADRLAPLIAPVPVTLADERMSTSIATRKLAERGVRGSRQRKVVDQVAAAEILQGWLDTRRRRRDHE